MINSLPSTPLGVPTETSNFLGNVPEIQRHLQELPQSRALSPGHQLQGYSPDQIERALSAAAFQLETKRLESARGAKLFGPKRTVIASRGEMLKWFEVGHAEKADFLLDSLCEENSLLDCRPGNLYSFRHAPILSYYAAVHIHRAIAAPDWLPNNSGATKLDSSETSLASLLAHMESGGWHEAFLLLFELISDSALAQALVHLLFPQYLDGIGLHGPDGSRAPEHNGEIVFSYALPLFWD